MDQIEWVDAEVARKAKTSQAILNPAGFPIYVLHSTHAVPATFNTSRRRQSIARACQETERERALEARREREHYECKERYEIYLTQDTEFCIETNMGGDLLKRRLGVMRRKLAQTNTVASAPASGGDRRGPKPSFF